ncbi:hypothetical protein GIB67_037511 [Kingdonia uniflora]|uniref:Hexosyltransferase n=1 Tax=Kingdonia uniflora TaxID=39325 RepID=A0A7J7NBC1_9MAGN|nr:hypothetical protein GIB67_037511 [Kingdonia uniflora]
MSLYYYFHQIKLYTSSPVLLVTLCALSITRFCCEKVQEGPKNSISDLKYSCSSVLWNLLCGYSELGSGSSSSSGFQFLNSPFRDTTYTKIFVGGLAWETQSKTLRCYFEQFGEILEAVVIADRSTARSKGYGFLAPARLAASVQGYHHSVHVLFVTDCFPNPNVFTCKELVGHKGNAWLYKPNLSTLREKLWLPVGSCELAVPLKAKGERIYSGTVHREAYATILHSAHVYVCGAIAAAQSIRMVGFTRDLVILVDDTISEYLRGGLEAAGWKIRTIERIRNPKAEKDAYNEWNYSKFRLWQLTDYDMIIFIDTDLLILRNIDFLFGMPEISATGNNVTLFNSGVMVIEPSNCRFQLLMDHIIEIESYNGGDQGHNFVVYWLGSEYARSLE